MPSMDTLPRHVHERLKTYVSLLDIWRKVTNLISERAFGDIWTRHIADSIHVQQVAPRAKRWLDVGSGAGFPGVVIGAILADRQYVCVNCVESDSKKCAFLRHVAAEIKLPIRVYNSRVESLNISATGKVDAITAKAFASINTVLHLTERYMLDGAPAILPRGKTYPDELKRLDLSRYTIAAIPGLDHSDGGVVEIRLRGGSR